MKLDEPTNNLDPASREEILGALRTYEGAIVLVTHEPKLAARCPRAIRLMDGQSEIAFRPRGPARLRPRGGAEVALAGGATARVRLRDGRPAVTNRFWVGGRYFIGAPVMDMVEIGAGGGSVVALDQAGAVHV